MPSSLGPLEKRYHLLGVEWLLSTPEDVVDLQILSRKFEQLGNRYALPGLGVFMLIVPILNRNSGGNYSRRFSDQGIGMIQLPTAIRQQVRASHADLQLFRSLVDRPQITFIASWKPFAGHEVGVLYHDRLREGSFQSPHIRDDRIAVDFVREAFGEQASAFAEVDGALGKVDSFDTAVELLS